MQPIPPTPPASASVRRTHVIAFRLDPTSREALATQAARLEVSVHELARHYVVQALTMGQTLTQLTSSLALVHEDLHGSQQVLEGLLQHLLALRLDLALAVQALLVASDRVDAKQAQAWAEANLNQPFRCSP